jgi:hypothetical protein
LLSFLLPSNLLEAERFTKEHPVFCSSLTLRVKPVYPNALLSCGTFISLRAKAFSAFFGPLYPIAFEAKGFEPS